MTLLWFAYRNCHQYVLVLSGALCSYADSALFSLKQFLVPGDGARRLHGQSGHIVATSNHQPQHGNHGNASRFPDFLDTLPASSVDFSTGNNPVAQQQSIAQACPNSGAPPSLDSNDLDFDVESVLNNVKTESVDSPMVWI